MSDACELKLCGGLIKNGFLKSNSDDYPLISIITVVFNDKDHIEETIRSVICQSYDNIEYIIVDGGSTDGTIEIIKKYEHLIDYWISENDSGIYDAMNKGILISNGASIGLLNCGDTYKNDYLMITCYGKKKYDLENSILYSDYEIRFSDLGINTAEKSTCNPQNGMTICHQAMLVGSEVYRRLGLYNTEYKLSADYDFLIRICLANIQLFYYPIIGVSYLYGGASSLQRMSSLIEACKINALYYPFLSIERFVFFIHCIKEFVYRVAIIAIINKLFGDKFENSMRLIKKKLTHEKYGSIE